MHFRQPPIVQPPSQAAFLAQPCSPAYHPPIAPAGKEYAINQLVLFLAIASLACDWTRTRTDKSGESHPPLPPAHPVDTHRLQPLKHSPLNSCVSTGLFG